MLERFRQTPALQRRGLTQASLRSLRELDCEHARFLLEKRQVMFGVEDELAAGIAAWMTGNLDNATENHDFVDEALHQDVVKAIGGGTE